MKKIAKIFFLIAFNILLTVILVDGSIELSLMFPQIIPDCGYKDWLQAYHLDYDRSAMHLVPVCSMPSNLLGYKGRPDCVYDFNSREFTTTIKLNSKGVRNPESSLEQPEILVIGDSQAFGWGVEREQSFPALLEKWTGRKVITVAFPSYGTAREAFKLWEFDLSHIKWVIVQYHENDRQENFSFVSNSYNLNVMTTKGFWHLVDINKKRCRYWPGKHTYHAVQTILAQSTPVNKKFQYGSSFFNPGMEANMFTAILLWSEVRKLNAPVWVVQLSAWGKNNDDFHDALLTEIEKIKEKHKMFQKVFPVSVVGKLSAKEHYFILDDHLNPAGHQEVAKILMDKMIKKSPNLSLPNKKQNPKIPVYQ